MYGSVRIETTEGGGATFILDLPAGTPSDMPSAGA